ncbi:hypothetical protein P9112_005337 [Eukaryota sp. TZLM1-RC]
MAPSSTDSPLTQIRQLREKRDSLAVLVALMRLIRRVLPHNYADVAATSKDLRSGQALLHLVRLLRPDKKIDINVKSNKWTNIENWKLFIHNLGEMNICCSKTEPDYTSIVNNEPFSAEMTSLLYKFMEVCDEKL